MVSIVIPNYNYGRYLKECIDSALCQTYSNIEILVVDDGSTDDSEQILQNYGDRIKYFRCQNQGVSRARNFGVERASGEFIAFLDSDDKWEPDKIEKQLSAFSSNPQIGLVHCGYAEIDAAGHRLAERLDGLSGRVAEEMLKLQQHTIGCPSTIICRREVFDNVGNFDPDLPPCEDWEWAFRVSLKYMVGFVKEPLILYRVHGSNSHLNVQRLERAMILAFEKSFATTSPELRYLKRQSYGRLHSILAGSYFHSRDLVRFVRHVFSGIFYSTDILKSLFSYSLRRMRLINSFTRK